MSVTKHICRKIIIHGIINNREPTANNAIYTKTEAMLQEQVIRKTVLYFLDGEWRMGEIDYLQCVYVFDTLSLDPDDMKN